MQRLSLISLAALVAVGGILAVAVFVHPAALAPQTPQQHAGPVNTGSSSTGSNSTLLTNPPQSGSGDDDGGGHDS